MALLGSSIRCNQQRVSRVDAIRCCAQRDIGYHGVSAIHIHKYTFALELSLCIIEIDMRGFFK